MKNTLLILGLILTCMTSCTKAQGLKYAIVIGAGQYPDSSGWPSTLAAQDAKKLAKALEDNGWETFLFSTEMGPEAQPKQSSILKLLGLEKDSGGCLVYKPSRAHFSGDTVALKSEDEVIFIWGGHGLTQPDNGEDFLVPIDVTLIGQQVSNPDKLISCKKLQYALKKTGAGKIMIFMDACRTDVAFRKFTMKNLGAATPIPVPQVNEEEELSQGVFVMHSSENDEFSHDDPTLGGGVFSFFLHKLLTDDTAQMEADITPKNNNISLLEAAKYLKRQTEQYVNALSSKRSMQRPYYEFGQVDELLLNFAFINFASNQDDSQSFETWLSSLLKNSDRGFADVRSAPLEIEGVYSLLQARQIIWGIEFKGTYERDFAERDVLVFSTTQENLALLKPCLDKIINNLSGQFGPPEKRHTCIHTFTDSRYNCAISVIQEAFPCGKASITLEIRKNKH